MPPSVADLAEPHQSHALAVVRVLFFGRLADVFGGAMSVTIPTGGCSVSDLKARIATQVKGADEALSGLGVRVAIDQHMAGGNPWVSPGQEVAFLPAFSGG